jgi:hypothetical protein
MDGYKKKQATVQHNITACAGLPPRRFDHGGDLNQLYRYEHCPAYQRTASPSFKRAGFYFEKTFSTDFRPQNH